MMDKSIKEKLKKYKHELLKEAYDKQQLLSAKSDFTLLEQLIQKCNVNPGLKVEVRLKDGTILYLKTTTEEARPDPYTADAVVEVF